MEINQDEVEVKDKRKERIALIKEWIWTLVLAVGISIVLTQVVFLNAVVLSASMEDTVMTGDRLLGLRMAYWIDSPQRGDVVVFRYPDNKDTLYVKRVVGLPGDEINIQNGNVYINGEINEEINIYASGETFADQGPWTVPQDSYFMMGDNREHSWDSRYWDTPFVPKEDILSKVFVRIYPNPGMIK